MPQNVAKSEKKRDKACLKDLSRTRLLDEMVRGVTKKNDNGTSICAMVIDSKGLKVLSSSCKAYDMIEDGVVVWEGLEKARQPLPELDVIYLLSPCRESVQHILHDFESEKRPKYRNVHIFFTSAVPSTWAGDGSIDSEPKSPIAIIAAQKPLVTRIKSFVELNLAFVAYEKRCFHLDMPDTLARFYHPHFTNNVPQFQYLFGLMADRLASLFATFRDIPIIRYHTGQTHARLCETLAQQLQSRVTRLNEAKDFTRQTTQIVIIDRSYDLATVFMHGTTFQSQIYDILDIGVCSLPDPSNNDGHKKDKNDLPKRRKLDDVYSKMTMDGQQEKWKDFILTDNNDLYSRVRHREAHRVSDFLARELNQYKSESKTQKVRSQQNADSLNNEDVMAGLRELPQYRAVMDDFTSLINLSQALMSKYEGESLVKLVGFENALASNFDSEGKVVKEGGNMKGLIELLMDQMINKSNKLRLIILYLCVMRGVTKEQKDSLIEKTSLGEQNERMLRKFLDCGIELEQLVSSTDLFGFDIDKGKTNEKKKSEKHYHKLDDDAEKFERTKKWVKAQETLATHYKPEVRSLCEDMINGRLPQGAFPFVQQPEHGMTSRQMNHKTHADATGLKAKKRNWDFGTGDGTAKNTTDADEVGNDGSRPKMVLFIIGGVTMTEMQYAYELANSAQVDLYIGSTAVYTPLSFLEAIDRAVPDNEGKD